VCRLGSRTVTVSRLRRREASPNRASDTGLDPPGPGTSRPERNEWLIHQLDEETRNIVSCGTFLIITGIAVQLAEQGVAVFFGPVCQMRYKAFNLLTGSFAESFGAAEIDGVGLHQIGIELMLTDQLAEAVADFGTAVVSVRAIDGLGWKFL